MMPMSHSEGETKSSMASNIALLKTHILSATKYLIPLLPLASCHMVEFLTNSHWDQLLPAPLRSYLEGQSLEQALSEFWKCHENSQHGVSSELSKWIDEARTHYLTVNNQYCLNIAQLKERISSLGGSDKHELRVTEFMTQKKSYEVLTMSQLVASLFDATSASCSVEAGGGRGHLQVALSLAYNIPSLTVDCNAQAVIAAERRANLIKKQWHVITKRTDGATEQRISTNESLHQFATAYITENTDLVAIVRDKYPEHEDSRLLLTGLHTCGDLGPVSLRLFQRHISITGVFNVPCCYHLLSDTGFPMSQCLKGYELSRNARMLANHSIERMAHQRELPARSLVYRAMLEMVIKTYRHESNIARGKLKRISSKVDNFEQYFKMADDVLKLHLVDTLPEGCFTELSKNEESYWKKLVLFYVVKLCLAQVVESVILCDRIMYLYENDFENVYLVKLFDPVLSPRCHSIVAVR